MNSTAWGDRWRRLAAAGLWLLLPLWAVAQPRNWAPIGPDHGTVLVAAHQPSNGALMLAGAYFGGLYRSIDWGYTWKPQDVPFSSTSVFALHWDLRTPGRVFAGLFLDGVWRSDDAGLTWQKTSTGLTDGSVQAVSVDPGSSQIVLAATPSGLFRSANEGLDWAPVASLAGVSARALAHDPARPGTAFVGTNGQGVFRSTDGGLTWSGLGGGSALARVNSLSVDGSGHLYAGTEAGVYQLPQGSATWIDLRFDLPTDRAVLHVLAHPTAANVVFATTQVGTYVISNWASTPRWYLWNIEGTRFVVTDRQGLIAHVAGQIGSMKATIDFGTTWVRADHGIQTAFIGGMATSMQGGAWRLLAGADLGVSSLSQGAGWKSVLPLSEGVFDLHVRGTSAYAGTETNGVFKSSDGGTTWAAASNGIVPTRVTDLSFTADSAPTLIAATGGGAYRSTDGGRNWSPIRMADVSYVHTVAADPMRPPIVWMGTGGGRVYRSLDRGEHFSFAGTGLPNEDIVKLVHAPWTGVYALTASGKLYSTSNDGAGWFPVATPCTASPAVALRVDPVRSWVLYLATSSGGLCKSESGGLSWTAINNGITQLGLVSLWINPVDSRQLWAGGVGRVYRTVDAGATWQPQASGLPAGPVTSLVGDSADPKRLYAVVYGTGLYESLDAGVTWSLRSTSDVASTALTIVPDPTAAGRLLAGTPTRGMQASADAGQNWNGSNTGMSLFVRSLTTDPGNPQTLYAGTLGGGVFRSQDGAANWVNVGVAAGNVFRLRSPSAQRVLVGTSNGVAESLDGGTSWTDFGQRIAYVRSMVADPADPRRVMVGGGGGEVRLSDVAGVRWQLVGGNLPRRDVLAMATCPDGTVLAAPEMSGVWKSSFSQPGLWTDPGSAGLGQAQVVGLACDPRSGFYYAATNGGGFWLSTSGGQHWTAINQGVVGKVASAVIPSATQTWRVWAAVLDGTVYRSDNAGLNWTAAGNGLPSGGVSQLAAGPDGMNYAATASGVYRRLETGTSWALASSGLPAGSITALWADPSKAGSVMAAVAGAGLYRSIDGGAKWTKAATDAASADVSALAGAGSGSNARVYAGTRGTGVAWSADAGSTFGAVQPAAAMPLVVLDIAFDPADANTVYLASGGQGLLVSRDGGAHWRVASTGLPNLELLCVVAHPTRSGEVYVGSPAGVFVTRDHGATWSPFNAGLVNKNATALHFDTVFPDTLYVGLEGGGIWYLDTRP